MAHNFGMKELVSVVGGLFVLMTVVQFANPGEQQGVNPSSGGGPVPAPDKKSCASMPSGICQDATITAPAPAAKSEKIATPVRTLGPLATARPTGTPRPVRTETPMPPAPTAVPTRVPDRTRVPETPAPTATSYPSTEYMVGGIVNGQLDFFETCKTIGQKLFLPDGTGVQCRKGCEKDFGLIDKDLLDNWKRGVWVRLEVERMCIKPKTTVGHP